MDEPCENSHNRLSQSSHNTSEAERISKTSSHNNYDEIDGQLVNGNYSGTESAICLTDKQKFHEQAGKLQLMDDLSQKSFESKSKLTCAVKCENCTKPLLTKYSPLSAQPTRAERCRYSFMCPPHGPVGRILTIAFTLLLVWSVLWGVTGQQALPGYNFFALFVLFVCCVIGGVLVENIRLPALLGMLIIGCVLRNVPYIDVGKDIDKQWSSAIRNVALVVILTRAGLGLDPKVLKKLSLVVIRLAFIPCVIEAVVVAITTYFLLGLPWVWGFMLGFVLAAVSPAVVVPSMIHLEEQGLGIDKGIPTLIIAAASIDDVLAISGFGIFLGIAFSKSDLVLTIFRGPLEAILGVVYGIVAGGIAWYLPHWKNKYHLVYRFLILFCGGIFAVFGSNRAHVPGAGALGCLTFAFVAAIGWRKQDGWSEEYNPMADAMAVLWMIFQPFLFGLIGNEIVISNLDGGTVGLGIATLCIGLIFRMTASFLAVLRTDLTWRERFFIPFAWLPKATVQAAIGPLALDTAIHFGKKEQDKEYIMALQILTIAVLVIIITAPLGSALIALLGPRFLNKTDKCNVNKDEDNIEAEENNSSGFSIEMIPNYRARPSGSSMPDEVFFNISTQSPHLEEDEEDIRREVDGNSSTGN